MLVPGGPALAPLVGTILGGITEAEAIKGASGAAKKAHVLKLVDAAVVGTNLAKPGAVDPDLAREAASHGIDAILTAVNAIQQARVAQPAVPALLS